MNIAFHYHPYLSYLSIKERDMVIIQVDNIFRLVQVRQIEPNNCLQFENNMCRFTNEPCRTHGRVFICTSEPELSRTDTYFFACIFCMTTVNQIPYR